MSQHIMLMGTSSHVGKSIITTALARIFFREGRSVAPFKAQNMALNSYVTLDGREMGRAQVAQAEAAGVAPEVDMNPVLLKPTGEAESQVIINGRPIGNMSAREYHKGYSLHAFEAVKEALARLEAKYDTLVIEGAGGPAEINLKADDIVNMRAAKYLHAPVLLIADIDRGGSLAALVGTLELLDEDERELVKGLVINKFRGDVSLFQPAIDFLEQKTGKPVIGVVPYVTQLGIDEEDSVSLEDKGTGTGAAAADKINIAVIETPKISNFTDFDSLAAEPDVALYYVREVSELGQPDLIMLPGSKNTVEDLLFLRNNGFEAALKEMHSQGVPVIGICGGYQMLGEYIYDSEHSESSYGDIEGLGLLPMKTEFGSATDKLTTQVKADSPGFTFLGQEISDTDMSGYEIHMGRAYFPEGAVHPFHIKERSAQPVDKWDGLVNEDGSIMGSYIHGIFDNDSYRRQILNALRARKGLPPLAPQRNARAEKEKAYERLADIVRRTLDIDKVERIMQEMEAEARA